MKKVLMATTAVAAFVAFSGTAQAQDPGMADFGATEGGGGAGSAFTVKTNGAVKFYLKYASEEAGLNSNSGLFALIAAELEFNGAATTDNGTDISTHIDLDFSGIPTDTAQAASLGGGEDTISVGNIVRVQELSMKIGGGWGSVELGTNDGAEDSLKTYGGTVGAGTGGVDGDYHSVSKGVGYVSIGGLAGSGDSSDALKATYISPNISGFQTGLSLVYSTVGPKDINGGTFGVGIGAKYAGSAGGLDYAVSLVWGDTAVAGDTSGSGVAIRMLAESIAAERATESAKAIEGLRETIYEDLSTRAISEYRRVYSNAASAGEAADRATPDAQYAAIRIAAAAAATTEATDTARTTGYNTGYAASILALGLDPDVLPTAGQVATAVTAGETAGAAAVTAADTTIAAAGVAAGVAAGAVAAGKAAGVAAGVEAGAKIFADVTAEMKKEQAADSKIAGAAAAAAVSPNGPTPIEAAKALFSDEARGAFDGDYGGLGIGVKLGGAGVTGVFGITLDKLGRNKEYYSTVIPVLDEDGVALTGGGSDTFTIRDDSGGVDINISTGVAYAIPGGKSNVSLTAALALPYAVESGATEASNHLNAYLVVVSADYAVLPGVTIATDLGYGDRDVDDDKTPSGGFTGLIRVKAAF